MNAYDIETFNNNSKPTPYCVCCSVNGIDFSIYYDKSEDIILKSIEHIREICKNNLKIIIFVHNLDFDGRFIISSLIKNNIEPTCVINNGTIYKIEFTFLKLIIIFRCSYKILNTSLDSLSIEKFKKMKFPHNFITIDTLNFIGFLPEEYQIVEIFDVRKKAIEYCMNDVKLTQHVIESIKPMINSEISGGLEKFLSSPSLSFNIFFKKYNDFSISSKLQEDKDEYLRGHFIGGRCEVYGNPREGMKIKHYDFKGMYGQCMLEKYHCGLSKFTTNASIQDVGFHTIRYSSNILDIPVLPMKAVTKKLIFPIAESMVGTF